MGGVGWGGLYNLFHVQPNYCVEVVLWLRWVVVVVVTTCSLLITTCSLLSKPQLNHNSTHPKITLSWVTHENDFAHPLPPPQKLNVRNIKAVTDPILMKLKW